MPDINIDEEAERLDSEQIEESVEEDSWWETMVNNLYKTDIDNDHHYADIRSAESILAANAGGP